LTQDDLGTIEAIEAAITRRMSAALSNIPAVRVELAEWLIRESGTDDPGAIELWVAAANEGIRELGRARAWELPQSPCTRRGSQKLSRRRCGAP